MEAQRSDARHLRVELQAIPLFDDVGTLQGVAEFYRDLARTGSKTPHEFNELKRAASQDALTQVANRGELETRLTSLVGEFSRHPRDPFSVIFADADHFKRINDTYGHHVGDRVLVDLANLFTRETYSGELVGRYGGEEFVIICPGTDLEQAERRAERLRTALETTSIGGIDRLRMTCSFGVAQVEPGDSVESLLRRADKALYKAKENGRNRTCSLSNADLLQESRPEAESDQAGDPWLYTNTFLAVVASEMVVYKLGGFVSDNKAVLLEVSPERVIMRVGRASWLPTLSWTPPPPPVEIELIMAGMSEDRSRSGTPRVRITVRVKPQRWLCEAKAFQERAHQLVRELRQYFAAE